MMFPRLFSPLAIGGVTLAEPHRLLRPRHRDGRPRADHRPAHRLPRGPRARRRGPDRRAGRRDPRDGPLHQPRPDGDRRLLHPRLPRARGGGQAARHRAVRAALPPRPGGHGPGRRHADGGGRPVGGADRAVPGHAAAAAAGRDPRDRRRLRAGRRPAAAGRPGRRRGRRQPRLPPVAVPQPGHQPARRRVRRHPGEPAPVPAGGLRVDQAALRARVRGGPAHLPGRAGPVRAAGRHRVRRERVAGRGRARRLPERDHRDLRLAGRV